MSAHIDLGLDPTIKAFLDQRGRRFQRSVPNIGFIGWRRLIFVAGIPTLPVLPLLSGLKTARAIVALVNG